MNIPEQNFLDLKYIMKIPFLCVDKCSCAYIYDAEVIQDTTGDRLFVLTTAHFDAFGNSSLFIPRVFLPSLWFQHRSILRLR